MWTKLVENLQENITVLDVIKKICDSWEEVKISILKGVWKKQIPTVINDFKMFKTSVETWTADVVKMIRDPALEAEPEGMTELLRFHSKTWMAKELLPMNEPRKWFPKMDITPVKMLGKV